VIDTNSTPVQDLLDNWHALSRHERLESFHALPRDKIDDFFLELNSRDQLDLLREMPQGERRIWLRLLAPDDAADVIQLAPDEDRKWLLEQLDDSTRREVTALMAYQKDEAGGLMNPRFARLRPEMTTDEAIGYLRRQASTLETIYYAYVLDDSQRLLGVISFRDLFKADRNQLVQDVMRTRFVAATEDMDQEAVAKLVSTHRLLAVPVVDREGRMQGIVTVDDIVEVVQEEASEDIQK
jgi:magnesium transporter